MTDNEDTIEIPGYIIQKRLGRGGMAEVYLAVQESVGRNVAIKIMLPQLLADKTFSERFLREARIAATLDHPNIVAIYDVGVAGSLHYISMGYLPGGDLKQRIKKGMSLPAAVKVMKEICGALDFAAKMDFVHRDIKPENILFSQTGAAVLSDFGIARGSADDATNLTMTGSVIGTPHFMSPEQAQGKKVDGRSDLYSMGIVFYQMLTGELPYTGDSAMSIALKQIRDPIPDLPEEYAKFGDFLKKLVAKEPDDRWQTGAEVVRTLEALQAGEDVNIDVSLLKTQITGETVVANSGTQPAAKRSSLVPAIAGFAFAGVALGGYLFTQGAFGPGKQQAAPVVAEQPKATENPEKQVQALLAGAAEDMVAGRYFEPKGENATEKFRSVLILDAENDTATKGLRQISNRYIDQAESQIRRKRLEPARAALRTATEIDPANPRLDSANRRLYGAEQKPNKPVAMAQAKATPPADPPEPAASQAESPKPVSKEAKRQQKLERKAKAIVGKADHYLDKKKDKLSRGVLENAADLYRKAKRVAATEPSLVPLGKRISKGYVDLANQYRSTKKWKAARKTVEDALEVFPGDARLLDLKQKIANKH